MAQSELLFESLTSQQNASVRQQPSLSARRNRDPNIAAHALLLTVSEVADRLGCGRTLVYELISAGELEAVKLGRLRRVPTAAVDALVERLRDTGRNAN